MNTIMHKVSITLFMMSAITISAAQAGPPPSDQKGWSIDSSTLSGQVKSASVSVPANQSAMVWTTPEKGYFILTQTCVSLPGYMAISGNTFGTIVGKGSDTCHVFTPGIALPQNETITCMNVPAFEEGNCLITGVLQK